MRIAIVGSPRAGKTTLAYQLSVELKLPIFHTDDLIDLGWSAASESIAQQLAAATDPCIFEGVAVVRGLRKALLLAPTSPVDRCLVLERPRIPLTRGQEVMRRGCATVLANIEAELVRRGVELVRMRMQ